MFRSFVAVVHLRPCLRVPPGPSHVKRSINASAIVRKAKPNAQDDEFDPFVDEDESGDALFDSESARPLDTSSLPNSATTTPPPPALQNKPVPAEIAARTRARFEALYSDISGHLTKVSTAEERAAIRRKSLRRLIDSARTREEWQRTADLIETWRTALGWKHKQVEKHLGAYWYLLKTSATPTNAVAEETRTWTAPEASRPQKQDDDDLFSEGMSGDGSSGSASALSQATGGQLDVVYEDQTTPLGRQRALFRALNEQLTTRLVGETRSNKLAPRKSLTRMSAAATSKQDLEQMATVLAIWREIRGLIDSTTADVFLGRCVTLDHPMLAVDVLSNQPKYGMELPNLNKAHSLLHLLYCRKDIPPDTKLDAAFIIAGLVSRSKLGWFPGDTAGSAMLIAICEQVGSEKAKVRGSEVLDDWKEYHEKGATKQKGLSAIEREWKKAALRRVKSFADGIGVETTWMPELRELQRVP